MKLTKELDTLKRTKKELIKDINSPKHITLNSLIDDFEKYLKNEIGVEDYFLDGDKRIYKYINSDFECHIFKNGDNENLSIKLIMPECFGNNTIIEINPSLSTPLNKIGNNIKNEINEIKGEIEKLKEVNKTKIVLKVNKIECPDRQYPQEFKFDRNKEFTTIQDAMEYAVDDIMGNK